MNILFIANHLNPGGITSYLLTLAGGLREKGHCVFIASRGGQLSEKFENCSINLIEAPLDTKNEISPKIIRSFFKLKGQLKKNNIQLIHSNSRTTQVLGCLLSCFSGVPHVFTCHGFFKPRRMRRLFPCWGCAVIAISQEVRQHLISDFKLPDDRITLINNGIDTKKFGDFSQREKIREKLNLKDLPLVGIIARLSDVKGHIYLIRAAHRVIRTFAPLKLVIIGEGKEKEALEREAANLSIKDDILFIPDAGETKDMLSAMDIFVMPSLQEGLGLALMEAMAQGLAVIGSNIGGIRSLIKHKYSGLLVEPGNVTQLAEAIIILLKESGLRRELGNKARNFIRDNFSKEGMVEKTQNLYLKCLKN